MELCPLGNKTGWPEPNSYTCQALIFFVVILFAKETNRPPPKVDMVSIIAARELEKRQPPAIVKTIPHIKDDKACPPAA